MAEYFTKDGDDYVPVEGELHTQEHVDQIVKQRAERLAKQNYGDYDDLKAKAAKVDTISQEFEDKLKSKDDELAKITGDLTTAKLETDKVKLMQEFGLSDDLGEFVTGTTVDEMRSRAEKLSKGAKGGKVTVTKTGKPDEKTSDTQKIAKGLFKRQSDD